MATLAMVVAVTGSLILASLSPSGTAGRSAVSKGYELLVRAEFLVILVVILVESASSIAGERRNRTWESIRLTDLSHAELVRGKPRCIPGGLPGVTPRSSPRATTCGRASRRRIVGRELRLAYLAFAVTVSAGSWLIATGVLCGAEPGSAPAQKRIARGQATRSVGDAPVLWRESHEPGGRRIIAMVALPTAAIILATISTAPGRASGGISQGISERTNAILTTLMLASGVAVAFVWPCWAARAKAICRLSQSAEGSSRAMSSRRPNPAATRTLSTGGATQDEYLWRIKVSKRQCRQECGLPIRAWAHEAAP